MNAGKDDPLMAGKARTLFAVKVTGIARLTDWTFEISFQRPKGFDFLAGQKIGVVHDNIYRDYSLISPSQGGDLAICLRLIPDGVLSPVLTKAAVGDILRITPAFGYFLYQPSERSAVFVATGTGIAPFVAFARAGAIGYHLLHGVRSKDELYYQDLLSPAAKQYIPCLSIPEENSSGEQGYFRGRVTEYLECRLTGGAYDFYLCGRGEMLRDATRIIDRRFEGSRIYSELFF